uniref:WD-40 repeat-containing protein MSI4 n=1 Tax=Zea mays TaxID=4577 RepID=A0A804RQG3_MAIZE
MVDIGCGNLDVQGVGVGMMSTFFPIVIQVLIWDVEAQPNRHVLGASESRPDLNSKIIATHTDSPDVLIWDVEAQPNRHAVLGASESRPDLEIVEFALAMCPAEPYVLSEGKDKSVVLWSIQDHISALGDSSSSPGASDSKQSVKTTNEKESPKVDPRGIFHGHDSRVEDVQFYPSSAQEFCSVGDDACLILWDARTGTAPAVKVEKAHSGDVHCVDWNPLMLTIS